MSGICSSCPAKNERGVGDLSAGEVWPWAAPFYIARRVGFYSPDEIEDPEELADSAACVYSDEYGDTGGNALEGARLGVECVKRYIEGECGLTEKEFIEEFERY